MGAGGLQFESADYDWRDYAREIYWQIWWAWHRRLYESANEFEKWAHGNGWYLDDSVDIRFVILSDGDVVDVVVERGHVGPDAEVAALAGDAVAHGPWALGVHVVG